MPLTFDHVMAKVSIELTYRNQWADEYEDGIPAVEEVYIANVASDATIDCLNKDVQPLICTSPRAVGFRPTMSLMVVI